MLMSLSTLKFAKMMLPSESTPTPLGVLKLASLKLPSVSRPLPVPTNGAPRPLGVANEMNLRRSSEKMKSPATMIVPGMATGAAAMYWGLPLFSPQLISPKCW